MNDLIMASIRVVRSRHVGIFDQYEAKPDLSTANLLRLTDGLARRLLDAWGPMPAVGLSREERQRLGGILLPGYDNEIVERVAVGMLRNPELFRDIDCDPADLRSRQLIATRLDLLRSSLGVLTGLCDDLYLIVQADALRRAFDVIDRVRAGAARAQRSDVDHHYARASALSPAVSLLMEVRERIRARRGKGKSDRSKEQAEADAEEKRAARRRRLVQMFSGLR